MPSPIPTLEGNWYFKREPCADRLVPDNTTKFGEPLNRMTGWTGLYTDAKIAELRTRAGGVNRMRALLADPDTVLDEATRGELTDLINDLEDLGARGWQGCVDVTRSFERAGTRVERIFKVVEKQHRREMAQVSGLWSCVCPECRYEKPPCTCPKEAGLCPICFPCAVCLSEGMVSERVGNVRFKGPKYEAWNSKYKAWKSKSKASKAENKAEETDKKAQESEKKAEENEKEAEEAENKVEETEKEVEGKGKEKATE
ncbi:hypothetical protein IQ07DRAFT_634725 [Pyrenochaeta sp. DS3sAY3a]|nr:hypothetical protein IQ07DRAFT_634725 [Pyrenochaeta sp. DS3sAY3a]